MSVAQMKDKLVPKTRCDICETPLTREEQDKCAKVCEEAPIPLSAAWHGLVWTCNFCDEEHY